MFEDQKDSIKLKNLVSSVVDKETQEKIDLVKDRLMKNYGYCEICSTDVLNFVASIFARGDAKEYPRVSCRSDPPGPLALQTDRPEDQSEPAQVRAEGG